jgi:hypothetical protein
MSISALTTMMVTMLGAAQPQNPAVPPQRGRLPEPPPTTVTRQVPVAKQVVMTQKRLVPVCVLVCPPGKFRRPYYVTEYRVVEEQVTMTVTEMQTVTETIPWNGTPVFGTATIINLPTLSGGLITDVFDRTRETMVMKNMLPPSGTRDPRTYQELLSSVALDRNASLITSAVFEFPGDPASEFQIVVQSDITRDPMTPQSNRLSFRVDVRVRPKGSTLGFTPADPGVARAILTDLFMGFPYMVTPN